MSGAVSDPNSLTKDKLKRELLKHDVTLPPGDARKDVYVGLYREHVLGERVRLELFSSDDEGVSNSASKQRQRRPGSPRKSPVKKPALKKSSPVIASHKPVTMDVYSLTDEELLDELRKYNVQCGPILDSTRRIYQKKLIKVLSGGAAEPSSTADTLDVDDVDYSDQESEPEPEPEPEPVPRKTRTVERREIETREVRQRVTRQPAPPPEEYERATREEPPRTTYTSSTRSSTTTYRGASAAGPVSADDLVTQATPDPAATSDPTQKGGLSIWVQLIIVLIVALIIFLVFQNMESASKGPTRQLGAESEV